jgi:hypothetical protein
MVQEQCRSQTVACQTVSFMGWGAVTVWYMQHFAKFLAIDKYWFGKD